MIKTLERAPARSDNGPTARCVMQCGRLACGMRVDKRDLCAHCFMTVVEIVAHEIGALRHFSVASAAGEFTGRTDPDLYSALGRATLPGIQAIARELGQGLAAHGERRERDDPNPAMCDDDR